MQIGNKASKVLILQGEGEPLEREQIGGASG
jgi:hypothetical protein